MRAVVQTVSRASVTVDGAVVGEIGDGLLVLLGVTHSDGPTQADTLARKVHELRIFDDERSAAETGAPLVVSQFTLYADTSKGRRPSWSAAAPAEIAEPLVTAFVEALWAGGARVATGQFRAYMNVESVNVGPHTVLIEVQLPDSCHVRRRLTPASRPHRHSDWHNDVPLFEHGEASESGSAAVRPGARDPDHG